MAFGKRIDKPGGSRKAARDQLVLRAVTPPNKHLFFQHYISPRGRWLPPPDPPAGGQELIALLGGLEAFATVVWQEADQCGIQFDMPLSDRAVAIIEAERVPDIAAELENDAILAASDWHNGLAC